MHMMDRTLCACGEKRRPSQRNCWECHARWMREHRKLNPESRKKANCRTYANVYLSRGKLKKGGCEVCGAEEVQMHHDDYTKPLAVRWFCRKHHLALHGKVVRC